MRRDSGPGFLARQGRPDPPLSFARGRSALWCRRGEALRKSAGLAASASGSPGLLFRGWCAVRGCWSAPTRSTVSGGSGTAYLSSTSQHHAQAVLPLAHELTRKRLVAGVQNGGRGERPPACPSHAGGERRCDRAPATSWPEAYTHRSGPMGLPLAGRGQCRGGCNVAAITPGSARTSIGWSNSGRSLRPVHALGGSLLSGDPSRPLFPLVPSLFSLSSSLVFALPPNGTTRSLPHSSHPLPSRSRLLGKI
jgi:hypothetical protein